MNLADVAIAFSQEEWRLLVEAQRLLYCEVMVEVFVLVASMGCRHKMEYEEAPCEQSVSVGESQVEASKKAPTTQKTHPCEQCVSVLKDILHLTEFQAAYLEQKAFFSDVCMRDFCFSGNLYQQQRPASGEKPWKGYKDKVSFVTRCSFYVSGVPFISRDIGKAFPAISNFFPHPAIPNTEEPHSGSESGQAFHGRKTHHPSVEYEEAASHRQKLVQCESICSGKELYENSKKRGEGRREGEKRQCVVLSRAPPTGDPAHSPVADIFTSPVC
ncbi:hypothetical protein HJG60_020966 [Phyllostomus discolor]|uniref:KRAB domain-containing protein n=1 Tax=Phyllostomus discolor TaxID=89673 RepID=A0A833YJE8_9CHIR|nr:hypothetical protein HJG60_020966 [Phyllostomus discolor]